MVWIYPVIATFAGSIVGDLVSLALAQLVTEGAVVTAMPFDIIVTAALLNAAIAALLLYPARLLTARYVADELPAW